MAEIIDWQSNSNHFIPNHKWPQDRILRHQKAYEDYLSKTKLDSTIFIASSATGGKEKLYALTKEAFLESAKAVIKHIKMSEKSRVVCCLPLHHVGGLAIYARAHILNQDVFLLEKWDPFKFQEACKGAQYSSLVPTQVFDLVENSIKAPNSLQAIFIGGDAIDTGLLKKAKDLNWPLYPTFGSSEFCSQVATAKKPFGKMELLDHIKAKTNESNDLFIKTKSLFHSYYDLSTKEIHYPLLDNDAFYKTEDKAILEGGRLRPLGRSKDWVKIMAELVNLKSLEVELRDFLNHKNLCLIAIPDKRVGHDLYLASENKEDPVKIAQWNQARPAFERIKSLVALPNIPKTELGKIKKHEIKEDILSKKLASYPVY